MPVPPALTTMSDIERRITDLIAADSYRPGSVRAVAKRLEVGEEGYREFKSVVKRLVAMGRISVGKDRLLRPSKANDSTTVGTFRRNAKGFGFVRPLNATGREKDIYIPIHATMDAADGDVVVARTRLGSRDGKLQGQIIEIQERAAAQFVGTYEEHRGRGRVRIDGGKFSDPVPVGDPGAKGAVPGDMVAIELVKYPSPYSAGQGVITEVLGPRGQPGVDTLSVIKAFNLPDRFDERTLAEAREEAGRFQPEAAAGRLDLTSVRTITIDPKNARDFDDAITLAREERGHWRLGVHIADVSWFVRPGSALDRSARDRGTSVYLPDRVLPMLPEVISNGLASLQEGEPRYALSAFIELDPTGIPVSAEFARTLIRCTQRFTYEQAYEIMMRREGCEALADEPTRELLGEMLSLAMILRKRRMDKGALELNMPETTIELGSTGEVVGAKLARDDESHQVIEEFMLAANEAVAERLDREGIAFLRRVHPDPEPDKLEQFAEFARALGFTIELPQSRFELQKTLRESASGPEAPAVHFGLLRSLKQARYSPEDEGHYALASDNYCHFTSPIRRYPDLTVHRLLVRLIAGERAAGDLDELTALGDHCTKMERRAEAAERDLIRIKLLTYLETRIGQTFFAMVTGVEEFGLFCRLEEVPAEGLLHVSRLSDGDLTEEYYRYEPESHSLVGKRKGGRYRLGDRLEVRISRVDVDRRELDLVLPQTLIEPAEQTTPVTPRRPPTRRSISALPGTRRSFRSTGKPGKAGKAGKTRKKRKKK